MGSIFGRLRVTKKLRSAKMSDVAKAHAKHQPVG